MRDLKDFRSFPGDFLQIFSNGTIWCNRCDSCRPSCETRSATRPPIPVIENGLVYRKDMGAVPGQKKRGARVQAAAVFCVVMHSLPPARRRSASATVRRTMSLAEG